MISHEIMAGKFHVYLRDTSLIWQCAIPLKGRNYRIQPRRRSWSRPSRVVEEWYLGLRGKDIGPRIG